MTVPDVVNPMAAAIRQLIKAEKEDRELQHALEERRELNARIARAIAQTGGGGLLPTQAAN